MARKAAKVQGVYEREKDSDLWYGQLRVNGKLVRKSFGKGPAGRAAAIKWVEKARTVRRDGGLLPATAKQPVLTVSEVAIMGTTGGITVGRLCDEFLKYVQARPEEYRDQKNPPKRISDIKEAFGAYEAGSLKAPAIEHWLDDLAKRRELANATINKLRGTFSMCYQHGRRMGLVDINPAADVPLRDVGNGVERFLSAAEEKRLRAALQAGIDRHDPVRHASLRDKARERMMEFDFALKSGVRKSEQYNLRWDDVDLERRIMRLRVTKNGKPRNAFIIDDVAHDLEELQAMKVRRRDENDKEGYVFSKQDQHKWWGKILKDATIKNFRWHDLRHTFCSRLVQAGVHLSVVKEAAGHSSIASTMRYAHLAPSQIHDALRVLNTAVTN
jgi:site-specific recombinase XerD